MADHPKLTEREVQEGWVEWKGVAPRPMFLPSQRVQLRYCDGVESLAAFDVNDVDADFFWEHRGNKTDIVAYRVSK